MYFSVISENFATAGQQSNPMNKPKKREHIAPGADILSKNCYSVRQLASQNLWEQNWLNYYILK